MKQLIIGLGNPGREFRSTPHNLGFRFLDQLQKAWHFSPFQLEKSLRSQLARGKIKEIDIILAKPQTFMNNSGIVVRRLQKKFDFLPEDIWVVHDDLDLPWGTFKIVRDRGSAGHKGVASIIQALNSQSFNRLRLGIKPATPLRDGGEYVLRKLSFRQRTTARGTINQAIPQLEQRLLSVLSSAQKPLESLQDNSRNPRI